MNAMKYVWMDEEESMFDNEDALVEVSYVEPWFSKVLMLSAWFQCLMAYEWML